MRSRSGCQIPLGSGEISMAAMAEHALAMTTELAEGALAMNRAMLEDDLPQARFRAKLLHYRAIALGDLALEKIAGTVVELLGPPGSTPNPVWGPAMLAVSTHVGDRLADDCA
jgi:hypothetical protein